MNKLKLFLISFLTLFLELSLIRYIPANVRLVGFFSNLILIATFAGSGIGLLLTKRKFNFFPFLPIVALLLIVLIRIFQVEVKVASSEVIFFKGIFENGLAIEPYYLLPIIFTLVTLIFIPLGQLLGRMFTKFKPLTAYSIDIIGAICGIALFSVLALFSTSAWIWFLIISLIFSYIALTEIKNKTYLLLPFLIALVFATWFFNRDDVWSPYYKITVTPVGDAMYNLSANNISHQYISPYKIREPFYFLSYKLFPKHDYKNILIIGSGTGADTAVALGSDPNVETIDAVEIDPIILSYGKTLNPDHPYDDPRVKLHNTDGRQFLQTTNKKYDLIIFALTDSLTLANISGNVRLESFLYTQESFTLAKNHLTNTGLFSLYNYYRDPWLVEKIAQMLENSFGNQTYIVRNFEPGRPVNFFAGPKLLEINRKQTGSNISHITSNLPAAEDNWPFLYLKNKAIPVFYLTFLSIIAAIVIIILALTKIGQKKLKLDIRFFLFGAGFMLLETKSLTTFSLLFGTTWIVNSLVFAGILSFVLIANLISTKFTIKPLWLLYVGLFVMLILNVVISPSIFLGFSPLPRYLLSIAFYFLPIMLANLLFSQLFRNKADSEIAFGSNILGGVFGGLLEYSSLALGQQMLLIFAILLYLLSTIKLNRGLTK